MVKVLDNLLSPDNRDELIAATDDANNDGSIIKEKIFF